MTHTSARKAPFALALISLLVLAAPSLCDPGDEWDKSMKAGRKAYADGMTEKYIRLWGDPRPYPQFEKAEAEFLAALAQAQTFPAGDLRKAATLSELAGAYMEEGKFGEAEDRANQSVAIMEAALQNDDPRLGLALVGVAMIYASDAKTEEAAPNWNRGLAILQKAGGIDPESVKKLNFVASNLDMSGKRQGAEQIYRFIVDLRESTGVSDNDLRTALLPLARVQRGGDAEQDYTRILEIDKKLSALDDRAKIGDMESLAKLYVAEGKYAAAWPLFQRVLEIRQKADPSPESKIPKSFDAISLTRLDRELAQAYLGAGKDPEAEELFEQIISMEDTTRTTNGALNGMFLADDLLDLSRVYRDEHRYDEALDTVKKCQIVDQEIAKPPKVISKNAASAGPDRAVWFWLSDIELAEIYREKGDNAAAEPVFERSLEMTNTMRLAPGHPKLAQMLDNYATLLRDEGKYDQAESFYKRSLDTWAKTQYPDHPYVAVTLTNYSALLRKLDRPAEAEPLEARAASIRAKISATIPVN